MSIHRIAQENISFVRSSVEYYTAEVRTLRSLVDLSDSPIERAYWQKRFDDATLALEQYLGELVSLTTPRT